MKKILLVTLLFTNSVMVFAQDRMVSGKVTSSEDGSALPGVNVLVKGTNTGTVTNADGEYRLTTGSTSVSLIFSFIGLQTQEIPIGDKTIIDVQLTLDARQLSEVVVTGVGVATDKRRLAISVESVSGDKLPAMPSAGASDFS